MIRAALGYFGNLPSWQTLAHHALQPGSPITTPARKYIRRGCGMRCEQNVVFVISKGKAMRYNGKGTLKKHCGDIDEERRRYLCNRHELERLSKIRRYRKPRR